jgi:hypothetical protein
MALGADREASDVIRKGLDLFPDDVTLRVLQKKCGPRQLTAQ